MHYNIINKELYPDKKSIYKISHCTKTCGTLSELDRSEVRQSGQLDLALSHVSTQSAW